ncbi:NUDIX hydrolase [Desulfitobacterium sp.]|uniref:NUDIX hydrolase n=1 Tax=Desulfitobacterium sp. TaxID=49981 RepID=UPI002B210B27|nr:NUDIX hydrolase [Desulfitobacterium sp.]MEA4902446.1 NUDIX hydrolase [Desulfitobacterium sp.]
MSDQKKDHKDLREECVRQETIFQGRLLRLNRDSVRLPNGVETTREVIYHPGAVAIVAREGDELLLVRQYRYALERETLEIPAGKLEPGETPEACAQRELREETGYQGKLTYLGRFYSTPGFSNELIYLFGAEDLVWAPLTADDDEFLGVERMPWEAAIHKALQGEFQDAKTTLGILMQAGKTRD